MHTIFEEENKIQLLKGQHYNNFFYKREKKKTDSEFLFVTI